MVKRRGRHLSWHPPLLTPHEREDVSALDRFNVHRCPTRQVFSGTGLELLTRQATFRYLYHSATAAAPQPPNLNLGLNRYQYAAKFHSIKQASIVVP
ncbi:uncharacterized protein TNCV_4762601 [Trichonephila clavipes]|nr:uncharacterized protein TNCV_4762601 [Trichonephila clavipes]